MMPPWGCHPPAVAGAAGHDRPPVDLRLQVLDRRPEVAQLGRQRRGGVRGQQHRRGARPQHDALVDVDVPAVGVERGRQFGSRRVRPRAAAGQAGRHEHGAARPGERAGGGWRYGGQAGRRAPGRAGGQARGRAGEAVPARVDVARAALPAPVGRRRPAVAPATAAAATTATRASTATVTIVRRPR